MYAFELTNGVVITCVVVYGWAGGHQVAAAAKRTHNLMMIILYEMAELPDGPMMIRGDYNIVIKGLPTMFKLTTPDEDASHCTDLGAFPEQWGHPNNDYTYIAYNTNGATWRDLRRSTSKLIAWCKTGYEVHAQLRITSRYDVAQSTYTYNDGPLSAHKVFNQFVEDKAKNDGAAFDAHCNTTNFKDELHCIMDDIFERYSTEFEALAGECGTNGIWRWWSTMAESASAIVFGYDKAEYLELSGRWQPHLFRRNTHLPVIDEQTDTLQPNTAHQETKRLLQQSRRRRQIAQLAIVGEKTKLDTQDRRFFGTDGAGRRQEKALRQISADGHAQQ